MLSLVTCLKRSPSSQFSDTIASFETPDEVIDEYGTKQSVGRRIDKVISVGDSEVIRKLVSEDCKCWITGFPRDRPFSRNQMMSGARTIIDQFLPGGFNLKIEGMTAEGDRVAVEAQSHNHTVSGKLYNNFYHFLFEFRDGKVIRWMEYTNPMQALEVFGDVVRQLGRK